MCIRDSRLAALASLSLLAYNVTVIAVDVVPISTAWSLVSYMVAGGVGAILVLAALTLVRWRRPSVAAAGIVAGVGLAGGLAWGALADNVQPFWLGVSLAFAAWQIPVGLAIVDRTDLHRAAHAPAVRWWALLALGALTLVHSAAATWHRSTMIGGRPGAFLYNPIDDQPYAWVPAGTFQMGCSPGDAACASDERPVRTIRFTKGFWLAQREVSVSEWKRRRALPAPPVWRGRALNPDWSGTRMPIVNVTWTEAREYCAAVGGRLPTEAEWEYAARAGSTGARYGPLADIAWYADNTGVDPSFRSQALPPTGYGDGVAANRSVMQPVGTRRLNAWRLYDMLGNVAEWVEDDYRQTHSDAELTDPPADTGGLGASKSVRGGAWYNRPSDVRVSSRDRADATMRSIVIGFRCVWNRPDGS